MSYSEKLQQITALQEKIASYGEFSPDIKKKINYRFRLDWNYYSNAMEGGTLTRAETRSVMVGNLTVGGKPMRDVIEMHGHDEVVTEIMRIGKGDVKLSEKRIKDIHKAIIHEPDESKKNLVGEWKREPNEIINYKNEKFNFADPREVPDRIHDLLNRTNADIDAIKSKKKDAPHPVMVALNFHLEYLTIHPFYDGNGRSARILTNLLLISFGYPPIIIKDTDKQSYYQLLGDIQAYGGSPDLYYEFMADLLMRSQELVIDALEGKSLEDPSDFDKEFTLLQQSLHSSKEYVHMTWNAETKAIFYDAFMVKFLKKLSVQSEKLSALFNTYKRAYRAGDEMWGTQWTYYNDIEFAQVIKRDITNEVRFRVAYQFENFRHRTNSFDMSLFLEFLFYPLEFKIKYELRNSFNEYWGDFKGAFTDNYYYKEVYDDEEMDMIVSKISKVMLNYIKDSSSKESKEA